MTEKKKEIKKVKLIVEMIPKIPGGRLFELLKPENVDLSPFKGFEDEVLKLGTVLDPIQIEAFANKSKLVLTTCKNYAAVVYTFVKESNRLLKRTKAEAFLVRAEQEWAKKQAGAEKPKAITDNAKKAYVDLDEEVNECKKITIQWEALDKWFTDTYKDLENYHNWYKRLFDRVCQGGL